MSEEELAKMMGFGAVYSLKNHEVPAVGNTINVGKIYADAMDALNEHKAALAAAKRLKAASTRFLNFFKDAPDGGE
jgi:hypothetical protein